MFVQITRIFNLVSFMFYMFLCFSYQFIALCFGLINVEMTLL